MSILFKKLSVLFDHYKTLQTVLPQTDVFFVGGAIRDLLINRTDNPTDIDCSCKLDPETVWNQIKEYSDKDNIKKQRSFFRTEKFGTISLYHHIIKDSKQKSNTNFQYEITPFRTEGTYSDLRHPDELTWSQSLWEDSKRRDYTINALYRYPYCKKWSTFSKHTAKDIPTAKKQFTGHSLLIDDVLIIYNKETILQLDKQGASQEFIESLLNNVVIIDTNDTKTTGKQLSILIDPHNGLDDITEGIIQTVGRPEDRFQEDALRIIRGLRFATSFNYTPHITQSSFDFKKNTRKAIKKYAHLVNEIAIERIGQEVDKVFQGNNPYGFVALLQETELLNHVFPYVAECVENQQPARHHGFDTYSHTLLTLQVMQKMSQADKAMKLTMLYHDVGKPQQYAFIQKAIAENPENPDRSGYEHHTDIGIALAKKDLQRLCFPKDLIDTICWYIQYHHRPGEILLGGEKNIDKRLRALISDGGYQKTKNLIYITMADRLGQLNPIQPPQINDLNILLDRVDTLYNDEGRFTKQDLIIDGNRVMKEFSITPGPKLGEILDKTFEWVLTDHLSRNKKKKIKDYIKSLLE